MQPTNRERHLRCEDDLVSLEQSPGGVHEHGVRDAVDQVYNTLLDFLCWLSSINGLLKHHVVGLYGKRHNI